MEAAPFFPSPRPSGERVPEGRVRGRRACKEVPLIRRLRGTFSSSVTGRREMGAHCLLPIAYLPTTYLY